MKAQFEEKEFETQINSEISAQNGFIYAPGQVLENKIGIDVALVCSSTEFWKLFASPVPSSLYPVNIVPGGFELNASYWRALDDCIERFPKFKFNLFLQHKRPEYLEDARSKEWEDWGAPYFRFNLTKHQQSALESLDNHAGEDALVGYSSPAFYTYSDLWMYSAGNEVVKNTNFVKASTLSGHHRYTYVEPGSGGKACSEVVQVPGFDLAEEAARRRDRVVGSNRDMIFRLEKQIDISIDGTNMREEIDRIVGFISGDMTRLARSIVRVNAFSIMTKTRWMIGID
ncbi:hypothetical protein [Thalassobaculum sp.]|uniref:hypothetical protein n=1 Tax=Thalassobaculum sp. TaxID=2022740 RepID=UPI003B5CD816